MSAPEWPRKHGDVEEMRETAEESAGLGIQEIVHHYEGLIKDLDQPPVLLGHSFGGLIVELLVDRGLGRAAVAMSPAPPKGILKLPYSTLKVSSASLAHPSKWHGVVSLTLEEFTYGFVNTFPPEEAQKAYERYYVPRRVRSSTRPASRTSTCTRRPRSTSRTRSARRSCSWARTRTTPSRAVTKAQYKKYEKSPARTDYIEFEGRPHLHMAAPGWEEVTAAVDSWLSDITKES